MSKSGLKATTSSSSRPKADGFAGQRMSGTLKSQGRSLAVEIVGLVKDGKLVTVSTLTGKRMQDAIDLVQEVAATTRLSSR